MGLAIGRQILRAAVRRMCGARIRAVSALDGACGVRDGLWNACGLLHKAIAKSVALQYEAD
jgi:hypothetical protein